MELLFSQRSIGAMVHGILWGGLALMALAATLFALRVSRDIPAERPARAIAWLSTVSAAALWITVFVGTYVSFPAYRIAPPADATDLSAHPRALLLSSPDTAWLHSFGMEIKEHVPFIIAMLATAVAAAALRYRTKLLTDATLNRMASTLLAIALVLSMGVGLLGILINKVAPLQ